MNTRYIFLALLIAAAINLSIATTISVFVSDGTGSDDTGNGSMDAPFKTIAKARDYVRTLPKNNGDSIFVEIRGGTYMLTAALNFDSQDSGVEGAPITYRAYEGEEVILIGGVTIGGWTSVTDPSILDRLKPAAQSNVRVADLGSLDMGTLVRRGLFVPGGYAAMELFFKNDPMTLARYPNTDFMIISALSDLTFTFEPADNNLAQWQQESDPHAMGYWQFQWADEYTSLSGIQGSGNQVSAAIGITPVFGIVNGSRFYLLNFLSELDAPGEYYIDRSSSKMYFWPPTSDFVQSDVVVSVLDYVLYLDQTSYVNFEGLTIEATRKEGVYGTGVHDVTLYGLTVRNTGTYSITMTSASNVLVERCLIENSGETAVYLSGGDRPTLTRANITARNNVVRNFSRWCKTYNPAFKVDGVGITIEHNEMYNGPHNALFWSGNYHLFQYNVVHDVCKETQDVGAFYSVRDWTYRGTVIKHNLFYDITGYNGEGAVGVYLDDQYSSAEVVGNIFYNVTTGMMIGGGRDNWLHNNIVMKARYGVWIDSRGTGACGPMNNASLYATLEAVPIQSEVWATAFPELAAIYENEPNAPFNTRVGTNIIMDATTNYLLCTQESVTPYVTFSDDCLLLSTDDFIDALSRNFTFKTGALDKCDSDAFKQTFSEIPVDMIGVRPLPATPVAAPMSAPSGSSNPTSTGPSTVNAPKAIASAANILYANLLLLLPFML